MHFLQAVTLGQKKQRTVENRPLNILITDEGPDP